MYQLPVRDEVDGLPLPPFLRLAAADAEGRRDVSPRGDPSGFVEIVEDPDAVTAHPGLPLVLKTMRKLGVSVNLDAELGLRQRNNGATDSAKSGSIVLLMAAGGDCTSGIDVLRADKGLQRLVGAEFRLALAEDRHHRARA